METGDVGVIEATTQLLPRVRVSFLFGAAYNVEIRPCDGDAGFPVFLGVLSS